MCTVYEIIGIVPYLLKIFHVKLFMFNHFDLHLEKIKAIDNFYMTKTTSEIGKNYCCFVSENLV